MAEHSSRLLVGDIRLMVDARGTNPGGVRYAYTAIQQGDGYMLTNTGYEAVLGNKPNLHPRESGGKVALTATQVETDFIKI